MMKQLIINADDFGCDIHRNRGIQKAIDAGIVKSVSILPNGPELHDAIKRIKSFKKKDISSGVHINLSEGMPVSGSLKHIVREDGSFLTKQRALHFFSCQRDRALQREIEKEMDAQIKTILECGIDISHMDGHHHIHIMPAVLDIVIKKAKEFGIKWIRIPYEPLNVFETIKIDEPVINEAQFFSRYATIALPIIKDAGINVPDHFIGLYMKGRLSAHLLQELTKKLKNGVTEMMVHPGFEATLDPTNPFTSFSTKQREDELNALIDPYLFDNIKNSGIHLKSFKEVKM